MVHEDFGYDEQNQEGEEILYFTVAYDLIVERKKISFNYFQQWPTHESDRFYPY
jgi:hypothetical protein